MIGAVIGSVVLAVMGVRTRRAFAWDDGMSVLMLVSAAVMVVMCSSLLFGGRWAAALFTAALAGPLVFAALVLARVPGVPPARREDDTDDAGGGWGDDPPPEDPKPDPPQGGIDWDRFDEERETWADSGLRPVADPPG